MIGAMKAKLLPRKIGTLPLVTRWKRRVPMPAEKRAVDGSSPTRIGTRTVAPKATNRYWAPAIPLRRGLSGVVSEVMLFSRGECDYAHKSS